MMTATKPEIDSAVASLRRALRPFKAVKVAPSVNDDKIIMELDETADDNDLTKARLLERTGWEAWPVRVEGAGVTRDLARRRWG